MGMNERLNPLYTALLSWPELSSKASAARLSSLTISVCDTSAFSVQNVTAKPSSIILRAGCRVRSPFRWGIVCKFELRQTSMHVRMACWAQSEWRMRTLTRRKYRDETITNTRAGLTKGRYSHPGTSLNYRRRLSSGRRSCRPPSSYRSCPPGPRPRR